jgi:uncharacterized protein YprB with RNaseH-like and TPR domain
MLTNSFIHTPGIGYTTEQRIWEAGTVSWLDFLRDVDDLPLTPRQRGAILHQVEESFPRLDAGDYRFFGEHLPKREHWRVYPDFAETTAFLDIETTGLEAEAEITVVGIHDARGTRTLVLGRDLHEFPQVIRQYGVVVTFFGSCFDLPCLQRRFPLARFDQIHIDLCYLLKRLGHSGGLKSIEYHLGIKRSKETRSLSGWDAVRLWHDYQAGNPEALDLLLRYNREDVENLRYLLDYAYAEMKQRCLPAAEPLPAS